MSKVLKAQQTSLTPQAYPIPVAHISIRRDEELIDDPALEKVRHATLAEAESILAQARVEAERMIQEAQVTANDLLETERNRVQSILEAEVEEAKRLGYEEGFSQARHAVEAEYADRFTQIEQVYSSALEERRKYMAESESLIVDLSCEVARKIMLRESTTEHEWVVDVVRAALEEIHDAGKIEVRVHPDDFEKVRSNRDGLRKEVPGQTELLVLPDRGVGAGGCVVHTEFGNIDARIDTQLEEVRKALQEVAASLES